MSGGWIDDPDSRDLGWRTGTLDAAMAKELGQAMPLDHLERLADCVSADGLFDAAARTFRATASRADCVRGGPRFEAAWNLVQARAPQLWSQGTPLAGPIHVTASLWPSNSKPYRWPLAQPLQAFAIREDASPGEYQGYRSGVSRLVVDTGEAALLRQARERYFADKRAAPGLYIGGLRMTDGSTEATVYMRDAVPYEDDHGLLPFSN